MHFCLIRWEIDYSHLVFTPDNTLSTHKGQKPFMKGAALHIHEHVCVIKCRARRFGRHCAGTAARLLIWHVAQVNGKWTPAAFSKRADSSKCFKHFSHSLHHTLLYRWDLVRRLYLFSKNLGFSLLSKLLLLSWLPGGIKPMIFWPVSNCSTSWRPPGVPLYPFFSIVPRSNIPNWTRQALESRRRNG